MSRLLLWLRRHGRISATFTLGLLTLVLGALGLRVDPGFLETLAADGAWVAWTGLFVDAAGLLTLSEPVTPPANVFFVAARVAALLFAATAVVTVAAEVSDPFRQWLLRRRIAAASWWDGLVGGSEPCGHTVVVGLGRIGRRVVADLGRAGRRVIVVELDAATAAGPVGEEARRAGALVLVGDLRASAVRRRADLRHARSIIIATGNEALNLSVAASVAAVRPAKAPRYGWTLPVHVHLGDPAFAETIGHHALFEPPAEPAPGRAVRVHTFNLQERQARDLLLDADYSRPPEPGGPLAGLCRPPYAPDSDEDEAAHWVVIGFGPMGQTVALQAARLAHFSNGRRLRLSILDDFVHDEEAYRARARFLDRHPGFGPRPFLGDPDDEGGFTLDRHNARPELDRDGWADGHWRPAEPAWQTRGRGENQDPEAVEYVVNAEYLDLPTEPDAPALVQKLVDRFGHPSPPVRPAVVVCFEDERRSFRTALALQRALAKAVRAGDVPGPLPVFAYLPTEVGLAEIITRGGEDNRKEYEGVPIHAFGQLDEGELLRWIERPALTEMARAIHEEVYEGGPGSFEGLDPALRRSNEDAAAHLDVKLDALGARRVARNGDHAQTPGDPAAFACGTVIDEDSAAFDQLRRTEHNRWMGERLSGGWRYGTRERDPENQRRTSFVPWHNLPPEEKRKDDDQIRAIPLLCARAGRGGSSQAVARVPTQTENSALPEHSHVDPTALPVGDSSPTEGVGT